MYYISLARSFYGASVGICCMKIHGEMFGKLQVNDHSFAFTGALVYMKNLFTFFTKHGFIEVIKNTNG